MEETRLSWLENWYLSNDAVNANTAFEIRIHYGDGRTQDIEGKGCDYLILCILHTTDKDDIIWITQYPNTNRLSIGIQK